MDLISRQAAIEHLKKRLYETELNSDAKYPYYAEMADNRVSVWIGEVPGVEPKWIPCSERLPEEIGSYPVWTARGFGNHLSTSYWDGKEWSLRVVAWMPKPEPYKAESYESCGT